MTLIAIIITIIYLFLIGSLVIGIDRIPTFNLQDLAPKTKFSVVIPFRNEMQHLPQLLKSLSQLNYPTTYFEIILVNDESEDKSVEIIERFIENSLTEHPSKPINIKLINTTRTTNSPKKDAITTAIEISRHQWIVTTDADCVLPKFWLDSFDEYIQLNTCDLIVAPVTYSETKNFLERFQLLDVLSLQGSTLGGFGIKKPFLCNGANLAYKKELFHAVHGFEGNSDIGSGDDIFILEKALQKDASKVCCLKSEQCVVTTLPETTWSQLKSQRVRWAAKTSRYHNLFGKLVGIVVLLMNATVLSYLFFSCLGIMDLKTLAYLFIIKFGIDFLMIYKSASFFNQKEVLKSFFFAFLIYPFFSVYVAFLSVFKGFTWKERTYIK